MTETIAPFSVATLKQPKLEIADYVEQKEFPVPLRYASLADAIASGKNFIVRSENPRDWNGGSGILDSLFVNIGAIGRCMTVYLGSPLDWGSYYEGKLTRQHMTEKILAGIIHTSQEELERNLLRLSSVRRRQYCCHAGIKDDEYVQQTSYSYWELLPGLNRTVVADSAIENRYLIFTSEHITTRGFPMEDKFNFMVVEDGNIVQGKPLDQPEDSDASIRTLIDTCKGIRKLRRFPEGKCLVLEMQSARGKHYFLQGYEGRDFEKSSFNLNRPPKQEELEAVYVRGATSSKELTVDLAIDEGGDAPDKYSTSVLTYLLDSTYLEAFLPRRELQVVFTAKENSFFTEDKGHMPRSMLLKPRISAVFDYSKLDALFYGIHSTPEVPVPRIKVCFISDGRKGYLSRI